MNPGEPSPYPRNTRSSGGSVEINSISRSWKIVTDNIGPFLACSLLTSVPGLLAYALGAIALIPGMMSEDPLQFILGLIVFFVLMIAATTLGMLLGTGMVQMTLKVLKGERAEYSDIWSGLKSNPLGLLGALIIVSLAVNIGINFFYIPGLVIGALWLLVVPIMLDKNLGPIEALKESFHMMKDHVVMGSVVYLLAGLAAFAGVFACCIGIFATMPIYFAVTAVVYNDLKLGQSQPDPFSQRPEGPLGVYGTPPSPDSYRSEVLTETSSPEPPSDPASPVENQPSDLPSDASNQGREG